jgi:hypothetical protein
MRISVASWGGQTLTCAICWSSARGLGLFLVTGPGLDLLELGRWQVGQRGVGPKGWLRGHRRADASGADAAATGPALDDSSRVEDPGAGAVEVGISWSPRHLQH